MLKVAVVDSGINSGHWHIGEVAGGISFVSETWTDLIGHGTATAAAIQDHEPATRLYAVKIFHRSFSARIEDVIRALAWCVENDMDVVNLSLATAKPAHGDLLKELSRNVKVLVAPYEFIGLPAYPGSFEWVFGVSPDPGCPRSRYRCRGNEFVASPAPRPLAGVSEAENFAGPSFAVANLTGLICRTMLAESIRTADELRSRLLAASQCETEASREKTDQTDQRQSG